MIKVNFTLRAMLLSIAAVGAVLGYLLPRLNAARRQHDAYISLQRWVTLYYDYQVTPEHDGPLDSGNNLPPPSLLCDLFGVDFCHGIVFMDISRELPSEAIAQIKNLPHLDTVNFYDGFSAEAAVAIGQLPLKCLTISACKIDEVGFKLIGQIRTLRRLRFLNSSLNDRNIHFLGTLDNLQELDASGENISDASLISIKRLNQLRRLVLVWTHVSGTGLHNLEALDHLNTLCLCAAEMRDSTLVDLPRLGHLQNLQILCDDGMNIGDRTAQYISQLHDLRTLFIVSPHLTGKSLQDFSKIKSLRRLTCSEVAARPDAFRSLRSLANLEFLDITNDPMISSDNFEEVLAVVSEIKGLREIDVVVKSTAEASKVALENTHGWKLRVLTSHELAGNRDK
jgi:hypothetical protein